MIDGESIYPKNDSIEQMIDFGPFELRFATVSHQFRVRAGIAND